MARKLASVQKIIDIQPIPNKDRIVLATVCGWNVIVQKDQFNINDLCVFCEIDSVLPEKPEFEFLRNKNFRIKTMKMGDVFSQGICFPLSILPDNNWKENDDVTDIIGVTQYKPTMDIEENTMNTSSNKKSSIPKLFKPLMRYKLLNKFLKWIFIYNFGKYKDLDTSFPVEVSKTDETRIQNVPELLHKDTTWIVTEKVDGCSGTFLLRKILKKHIYPWTKNKYTYEYLVCSRNKSIPIKDNSIYWKLSDKYNIQNILIKLLNAFDSSWIAIQGECVGEKIQGNVYKLPQPDLYVFNVILPAGRLPVSFVKNIIEREGLKWVPVIDMNFKTPDNVMDMLSYAHGQSVINPDVLREGVVVRDVNSNTSFKAVDNVYLMKHE